jgi:transcriptional regulator with XRE-family HTH domain
VRALRERQGVGQAELARRAGVSVAHLNKLEAGNKAPNLTTLEALAHALGVKVGDLFAGEPASKADPAPSRAWLRMTQELRGKTPEYLRALTGVMRALDRAFEHARPTEQRPLRRS